MAIPPQTPSTRCSEKCDGRFSVVETSRRSCSSIEPRRGHQRTSPEIASPASSRATVQVEAAECAAARRVDTDDQDRRIRRRRFRIAVNHGGADFQAAVGHQNAERAEGAVEVGNGRLDHVIDRRARTGSGTDLRRQCPGLPFEDRRNEDERHPGQAGRQQHEADQGAGPQVQPPQRRPPVSATADTADRPRAQNRSSAPIQKTRGSTSWARVGGAVAGKPNRRVSASLSNMFVIDPKTCRLSIACQDSLALART